jgi:hypothetical protein
MAYNKNGTVNELVYSAQIIDVSTASVCGIGVVRPGRLVDGQCSISAALSSADGTITVSKYPAGLVANSVTCGTITLTQAASTAQLTFGLVLSGSEAACTFAPGDTLVSDADGTCDTTSIGRLSYVLRG